MHSIKITKEYRLKVGISSLVYPVTMARYFIDAFERRKDLEVFTVGPFSGAYIPWNGGMTLPQRYVKTPFFPLPKDTPMIPYEAVSNQMPKDLDLFIQIDAGWHFTTRPHARVVATIQTDPHVLRGHYQKITYPVDFTFCMQTPYKLPGEIYLPYACDDNWFYPEDEMQEYDACLIGLHYEQRDKLVAALRNKGMKVYYDIGVVYDEYRQLYNRSKVAISWSSLNDTPVRVWEAFGMQVPLVTNRLPDLETFFVEDKHYLGFSNLAEAVSKVEYALQHYDEMLKMARDAYQVIVDGKHTFDNRVQSILDTCLKGISDG